RTVTAGGSLFTQWVNPPYASTEYVPFSTRVVPDPNAPQTIYTASNRLWKSTAFGDGWTPVSTTTTDGSNWPAQTQVTAMAIAQSNSQIIMVSLYDQL